MPLTPEQAEANRKRDLENFFLNTLQDLGIGLTANLRQLVNNAQAKQYNSSTFMRYLRQTKEYRQRFTGIFRKNGSLKMSESQYLSYERQFEGIASRAGINLSPQTRDWLFVNGVQPSEFADRAQAVSTLNRNKDLYAAFRLELIQAGIKPQQVNRKGLLRFVLGRGNQQWYDLWNDAVARNAAKQAGLAVGRSEAINNLPQNLLERISGMGLSQSALNQGFEQLADDISTLIPDAQLFGLGLTKSDLVTLRFGGKGRQQVKERVDQIIATRNLQNEQKAQPVLQQKAGGGTTLGYGGLSGEEGE